MNVKLISSEKWSGGLRPDSYYGFWMRRPAVQKRHDLQSGQIGLSGLKRNIKAPLPEPVIIPTILTSKFLIGLLELIYLVSSQSLFRMLKIISSDYWRSGQIYCFYYPRSPSCHGYGKSPTTDKLTIIFNQKLA